MPYKFRPLYQLVEETGASVTNKGIYYEPGKEPSGLEAPPKLHLLVESNDEMKAWSLSYVLNITYEFAF